MSKKKKIKKNYYEVREQEMGLVCSACFVGIGTSKIVQKDKEYIFYHLQKEPKIYKGKNYCDSCYEVLMNRINKR